MEFVDSGYLCCEAVLVTFTRLCDSFSEDVCVLLRYVSCKMVYLAVVHPRMFGAARAAPCVKHQVMRKKHGGVEAVIRMMDAQRVI